MPGSSRRRRAGGGGRRPTLSCLSRLIRRSQNWKRMAVRIPVVVKLFLTSMAQGKRMTWRIQGVVNESLFDVDDAGEENDPEDSRSGEALFDADNSGPKIQLKEVRDCVDLSQNSEYNDDIARDLREELRKLKQAYETLTTDEDKEFSALLAVKNFLWNQFRTSDKDNAALLKIKEVEAAQATEAAQKLQQLVEEMQVAARNKDNEIGRLQAEAVNAKEEVRILEGKIREINSLAIGSPK